MQPDSALDSLISTLSATLLTVIRESVAQVVADAVPTTSVSPWLNTKAAAEYLCTTEQAIRALVKRGEIPVHRSPNARLLFRRNELDEWITTSTQGGNHEREARN
jgi:excisionase family DNA binding protein